MSGEQIFIDDLRERISRRKAIAVVGAGISLAATDNRKPVASWTGLLKQGIDRCVSVGDVTAEWADLRRRQLASSQPHELILAAEEIARVLGAPSSGEYARWLRETVGKLHEEELAGSLPAAIEALQIPIATTNYDSILEKLLGRPAYTWRDVHAVDRWIHGDDDGIVHLHGLWSAPETVVLGVRTYDDVVRDPHSRAILQAMWTTHTIIFIGFGAGLNDPNFTALLEWARDAHATSEYRHYRLAPADEVGRIRAQQHKDDRVIIVPYASHNELPSFLVSLTPQPQAAARATLDVQRFHVPFASKGTRVIGRERSLEAVRRALEAEVTPFGSVAALTGIGGLGKTQAAVEYCYAARNEYEDGVFWFDCSRNIETQMIRIAESSGWVHSQAEAVDKVAISKHRISQLQKVLIALDDVGEIEQLKDTLLIPAPPSRHFVMTSRHPIIGFSAIDMTQLALGPADAISQLRNESRRGGIGEDDPDALALVGLFDHLPLAIEIAGAYLRERPSVTLKAYAETIRQRGFDAPGMKPSQLPSFTAHAPNLREAVVIADVAFSDEPVLAEILTCFGVTPATSIGRSLLAAMVQREEHDVAFDGALDLAVHLRFLSREASADDRWRMHRLVWQVYHEKALGTLDDTTRIAMAERVALWFRTRHEDVSLVAEFETEAEQLRFWRDELAKREQNALAARMAWMEAYLPFHRGLWTDALSLVQTALGILNHGPLPDLELQVRALADAATLLEYEHRHREALPFAFEAAALARKLDPEFDDARSHALKTLAFVQIEFGEYEEALENANEALHVESSRARRVDAIRAVVDVQLELDRPRAALETLIAATNTIQDWPPDERALIEHDLGRVHAELREFDLALDRAQRSYDLMMEIYGANHPRIISALGALANYNLSLRRLDVAQNCAERALELSVNTFGPSHPQVAMCRRALGGVFSEEGLFPEALEQQQVALDILRGVWGPDHADTADSAFALGLTLARTGKLRASTALLQEAYRVFGRLRGARYSQTVDCIDALSDNALTTGDTRGAYALLQQHAAKLQPQSIQRKRLEQKMRLIRESGALPGFRAKRRGSSMKKK